MGNNINAVYEVTKFNEFVVIVLFVLDEKGKAVVHNTVGEYNNMEEAEPLMKYLESINAEIEYIDNSGFEVD